MASYTVSLLQPKIIRDLKLHERGLRIVERRAQNFLPLPDGVICLPARAAPRLKSLNSAPGCGALSAYPPRSVGSPKRCAAWRWMRRPISCSAISLELCAGWTSSPRSASGLAGPVLRRRWDLRRSAGDMLDYWFESDPIKAVLGLDAVVGNLASPYSAGSAYVLLHHVFGEVNGKRALGRHRRHGRDHAGHGTSRWRHASISMSAPRCAKFLSRGTAPLGSC